MTHFTNNENGKPDVDLEIEVDADDDDVAVFVRASDEYDEEVWSYFTTSKNGIEGFFRELHEAEAEYRRLLSDK